MNKQIIGIIIALFGVMTLSFAQTDLPSEEVEVIKDFDARLEETDKLTVKPTLPKVDQREVVPQVYRIPTKLMTVDYLPPTIKPLAMRRDKEPESYNTYLKLGYGIPSSPYAEIIHHSNISGNNRIRLNAKHHSANFKDLENQRFGETSGSLGGTYFFPEGFGLDANLGYTSDNVYYYGYNQTDTSFTKEEVHQRFNTFDFDATFFNGQETPGDINYAIGTKFYSLKDLFDATETGIDIGIDVTKWFSDKHPLRVIIGSDFTRHETKEIKENLNNFYINPSFTYHASNFQLKIGANLVSVEDDFTFYPDIEAKLNVVGNKLSVFAGARGDKYKNTYRRISDYNPFVKPELEIKNTSYTDLYGGIKGQASGFEYSARIGYKPSDNLPLYLNDTTDVWNRFDVIYDTVDVTYFTGSINAPLFKGFNLMASVTSNVYKTQTEDKAWHLPSLQTNIAAQYQTQDGKFLLRGEVFVENGVPFKNAAGEKENLNNLFDLSFGAEYNFTKNVGLFFELNNLADNKRERWRHYPTYGINVLGGITAKF